MTRTHKWTNSCKECHDTKIVTNKPRKDRMSVTNLWHNYQLLYLIFVTFLQ